MRAHGIDTSVWQETVNYDKAVLNGAQFVFLKASQLIADKYFAANWKAAKTAGLLRGAYHYLDWNISEMTQAELFVRQLGNDVGELPPVVDFEMRPPVGMSYSLMRGRLWNFLQYVEAQTGKTPMIYTGYYYWREYGLPDVAWAKYPLWLAWYATESIVKVPLPWTKWAFWQYSDKGDGLAFGCKSLQVDVNWYNGTVEELKAAYGGVTPPPVVLTLEQRVKRLEILHNIT